MGAEAIRDLLAELDIEKELKDLKNELKELSESNYKSGQKVVKIIKTCLKYSKRFKTLWK